MTSRDAVLAELAALERKRAELLIELVSEAVRDAVPAEPPAPAPALFDKQGIARELAVSTATVDRMVRAGCPYLTLGAVRRFKLADVTAWLERQPKPGRGESRRDEDWARA